MSGEQLLLIATGSSGAIILPSYLSEIKARVTADVVVVMTHSAQRFVRAEVVGWFSSKVITPETEGINPIELAQGAGHIVVLPASGNTVASAALGLMSTQATTVLAAAPNPCLFFPHMHEVVWHKRAMVGHVAALRADGHTVHEPISLEAFEISKGQTRPGLSMPGPSTAAEVIARWMSERAHPQHDISEPGVLAHAHG